MAVYNLRKLQLGKQTVWGTAVAATAVLRNIEDAEVVFETGAEMIGELGFNVPGVALLKRRQSSGSFEMLASYEQILYVLHGLMGTVSPTGSGPYTWTYTLPASTAVTPQIYTLEYGMSGAEYRLADVLISKAKFSTEAGEPLKVESDFIAGGIPSPLSMTSLSVTSVNTINSVGASVYLDALDGTPGTTALQGTLISFELEVDPKRHIKIFVDDATGYGDDAWDVSGSLMLEFNSAGKSIVDQVLSDLKQGLVEVKFTSGTNIVRLQFGFTATGEVTLFSDRDGNATAELSFNGTYSSSLGSALKAIVTNSVSTLA